MRNSINDTAERAQLRAARIHYKYLYLACLGGRKLFYEWKAGDIIVPEVSVICLRVSNPNPQLTGLFLACSAQSCLLSLLLCCRI